jgi:hypothetical protein
VLARASAAFVVALVCTMAPALARADAKEVCIAASEDAQQLRIDGKLVESRARLLDCANPECPPLIRQDCTQWMADVVASIPTVVLGARDAQGRDVIEVKASMDGALIAGRLDGRAIPVDPGVHTFRLESTGAAGVTAEVQVLVRAGEKNREIIVTLEGTPPAPGRRPDAVEARGAAVPPASWVLGGVAVAALGTALAFDIAQAAEYAHLDATCAGHCPPDQVNDVAVERWIAGVSAGVGVLALGAAAYVWLSQPSARASTATVALDVATIPRGAVGAVVGRF